MHICEMCKPTPTQCPLGFPVALHASQGSMRPGWACLLHWQKPLGRTRPHEDSPELVSRQCGMCVKTKKTQVQMSCA